MSSSVPLPPGVPDHGGLSVLSFIAGRVGRVIIATRIGKHRARDVAKPSLVFGGFGGTARPWSSQGADESCFCEDWGASLRGMPHWGPEAMVWTFPNIVCRVAASVLASVCTHTRSSRRGEQHKQSGDEQWIH